MSESETFLPTHRCYGSGRDAPWEILDSYGKIRCPHCGQRVGLIRWMHRSEVVEHDAPGAPER